jgi:hypothetical protein
MLSSLIKIYNSENLTLRKQLTYLKIKNLQMFKLFSSLGDDTHYVAGALRL